LKAELLHLLEALPHGAFIHIAQRSNFNVWQCPETLYVILTPAAESDNGEPNTIVGAQNAARGVPHAEALGSGCDGDRLDSGL